MEAPKKLSERRRVIPFVVEFVRFSTGFAVIIALALLTLSFASSYL